MKNKLLLLSLIYILGIGAVYALNLTRVKTWSAAEILTAADLNAEFNNITNHSITNADISSSAAIIGSKLDLSTPGTIGATSPSPGSFTNLAATGNTTLGNGADSITFNSSSGLTYTPAATWTFTAAQKIVGTWTDLGTVTTIDINGGSFDGITSLTAANNLDIGSYDLRTATLTADGLTSGRVVFSTTNGQLTDDTDLSFSTDTLTVTKIGAFSLTGKLTAGAIEIEGSNFDIDGGAIDGVTIGAAAAPTVTDLGTVTTADINGGTIDGVQIGGTTATGELIVNDASDDADGLGSQGTAGQFLQSAGAGANPTWANSFTDRGDPAAQDYNPLTDQVNFTDLDLSAIVPAGATSILLRVAVQSGTAGRELNLRENGNSNTINISHCACPVINVTFTYDVIVQCDVNRVIEYKMTGTLAVATVTVAGWWN